MFPRLDTNITVQQIFGLRPLGRVSPRAKGPPALESLSDFLSNPENQVRVIARPRCDPVDVIEVKKESCIVGNVSNCLGHCISAILDCGVSCRAFGTDNNIRTR